MNRSIPSAVLAAVALTSMTAAHGFAYFAEDSAETIGVHTVNATPIVWRKRPVTLHMELGNAEHVLTNGTRSWDVSAFDAINLWNQVNADVQLTVVKNSSPNPCNQWDNFSAVAWMPSDCGTEFGDVLGVARITFEKVDRRWHIVSADVVFNETVAFDAYAGPLRVPRYGCGAGSQSCEPTYDFIRVAAHEFGHVLGLAHPDEAGQSREAIMNSHISDTDTLMLDDIRGLSTLYGSQDKPAVPPRSEPAPAPPAAGATGGGGGAANWAGLLALVVAIALRQPRCRRRCL